MKSFKRFIIEARFEEILHTNPSMEQVKALAKRFPLRFAIDHEHNLHVGNANIHTHPDLTDERGAKIEGMIRHDKEKDEFRFQADEVEGEYKPFPEHPILDKFEKHGFTNSNKLLFGKKLDESPVLMTDYGEDDNRIPDTFRDNMHNFSKKNIDDYEKISRYKGYDIYASRSKNLITAVKNKKTHLSAFGKFSDDGKEFESISLSGHKDNKLKAYDLYDHLGDLGITVISDRLHSIRSLWSME